MLLMKLSGTKKFFIGCLLLPLLGAILVRALDGHRAGLCVQCRLYGIEAYIIAYYGNFGEWPESLEVLGRALRSDLRRWLNDVIVSEGITMEVYSEPTDKVFRALLEFRRHRRKFELELDCTDMEKCRREATWVIRKALLKEELRKERERREESSPGPL